MYYTSLSSPKAASPEPPPPAVAPGSSTNSGLRPRTWIGILIAVVILAAAIGSSMGGNSAGQSPSAPPAGLGLGLGLAGQSCQPVRGNDRSYRDHSANRVGKYSGPDQEADEDA